MVSTISGATERFLASSDRTQARLDKVQAEVSSGLRVQQASDDPAAVGEILDIQNGIAQSRQVQSNLGAVKTEVDAADSSLQSAVQILESVISTGAQGAGTLTTADARAALAQQVSALQESLVGMTQTSVSGRYIFSGDQDSQPPYQLDLTQPEGVRQLSSATATRVIVDANGTPITVARTAQEIFDARNADGTPAAGNVFAAVNSLRNALLANDPAAITQALTSLHSAEAYLNGQLAFYGGVENRIADATAVAQKFQTQLTGRLSDLRDADVAQAAVELSQAQVQQQASLQVEAKLLGGRDLFSYLA